MNRINKNQLAKLRNLYNNGQVHIPSRGLLEAMSPEELERFIQEAERTPKRTYKLLGKRLRKSLTYMIKKGYLDIPQEDLEFMSEETGEKYDWMGAAPDFRGMNCTQRQCKRLRTMMRKNLIDPISENELKSLSFKDAVTLIRTGDEHAMKRKNRRT